MSTKKSHKLSRHVGKYTVGSMLGRGSYSKVYMAVGADGIVVALKRVSLSRLNPGIRQRLEAEVSIMNKIKHPSIVQLIESFRERDTLYLVLEYVNGTELERVISPNMDPKIAKCLAKQLVDALAYLAHHNIVHRDIKPRNILVQRDKTLKLLDFGFARLYEEQDMMGTICGSPIYMAPELLQMQPYTYKADVWSLGIVLYQLVYGVLPFGRASSMIEIRKLILKCVVPHPDGADPIAVSLINSILTEDPNKRPSLQIIADHLWFNPQQIIIPEILEIPKTIPTIDKLEPIIISENTLLLLPQQSNSDNNAIVNVNTELSTDIDVMLHTLALEPPSIDEDAYRRQNPIDDYITLVPRSEPIAIILSKTQNNTINRSHNQYIGSLGGLGRHMVKWATSVSPSYNSNISSSSNY